MQFNKNTVRVWMRRNRAAHIDPTTGEVNSTELAENAAGAFNMKDLGGPLDDPDHWIWELAIEG